MRELLARRVRVGLEIAGRRHHEARHAERALEALFIDDALLHCAQLAGRRVGESLNRDDLPAARALGEERTRVVRHIVDEDRAGAALRAVAADLGAREPQLVADRHREGLLRHHVDATVLAVHVQRDETLHRARRRRLAEQRRRAEQVSGGGGDGPRGDDALDETASRGRRKFGFRHLDLSHNGER